MRHLLLLEGSLPDVGMVGCVIVLLLQCGVLGHLLLLVDSLPDVGMVGFVTHAPIILVASWDTYGTSIDEITACLLLG